MWCPHCQIAIETPPPGSIEEYREKVPLAGPSIPRGCPHCGSVLAESKADAAHTGDTQLQADAPLDRWEERLEEELAEVRELLAESSRLRASTTRVDPPTPPDRQPARAVPPEPNRPTGTPRRLPRFAKNALPRTPSVILLLLGVGLLSGPWIHGFESIGQVELSLEWVGQVILSVGGLLWLRDAVRNNQEISGKLDATIAGLHVLRTDIATPPQSHNAHHQLADLKRRLSAVARSVNF